jgi:putative spermidine/putrescine transport system ATP-binding protein
VTAVDAVDPAVEPALALRGLTKRYGDAVAVDGIDLDVRPGEFITLLGPSGSGKTTTLRMIAGFTAQDAGAIRIAGQDMGRVPPYRRDVGMVFQNYALFPHMTAAQNIAFPLQMRRIGRNETKERVAEALALVKLQSFGERYPRQLSGGQQQRIALARAVVFRPRLLLMDEPLGALDKKLREALQLEILRISRQLGATVIYVTHDQEEALVMSDRIAIFNAGQIEQLGGGEDLYDRPASLFVADFIGESNILRGTFRSDGSSAGGWLERPSGAVRVGAQAVAHAGLGSGCPAAVIVRPERLRIEPTGSDATSADGARNGVDATLTEVLYLGSALKYELAFAEGGPAVVRTSIDEASDWKAGDRVRLTWRIDDGVLVADPAATPSGQADQQDAGGDGDETDPLDRPGTFAQPGHGIGDGDDRTEG